MDSKAYDVVCFGEILWDLLPSGARPGGAPMNVAYHTQKLGLPAALISRIGQDPLGEQLNEVLSLNNLTTDFIQRDTINSTGVVNASIGANDEVSYDIVFPVAWDFIQQENLLPNLVSNAEFFVYGSLVARDHVSRKTLFELISFAQTKVLDINIRPPHFSRGLVEDLLGTADILKLNEHELPLISSWYHSFNGDEEQVQWLQERFSIPTVVVTKGGHGAFVCHEGNIYKHEGFRVKVADTIGSGDAFLAGFLSRFHKGEDMNECLRFANSMGAFIASKSGACPQYEKSEVMEVLNVKP